MKSGRGTQPKNDYKCSKSGKKRKNQRPRTGIAIYVCDWCVHKVRKFIRPRPVVQTLWPYFMIQLANRFFPHD